MTTSHTTTLTLPSTHQAIPPEAVPEKTIELLNLNKRFGNKQAVFNLSFNVERGSIFGFLGPNGSGKSTTIKMMCGLLQPSAGEIKLLGRNIKTDIHLIRQHIGYMSQQFGLYPDLTVMQNLRFYAGLYGVRGKLFDERLAEVMALTNIEPYLKFRAGHLSGGWKQRLALGCAIIHKPYVIFLDEPTAGIDPVARRDLWDLLFDLSSQGVTLFVTTHYMDEAERCHKVGYIYEGQLIAFGTSDELRKLDSVNPDNSRRLMLLCDPLMKAYRDLNHVAHILDVTIFGNELHLLLDNSWDETQLASWLTERGFEVHQLKPIEPSLEDVFVALTQAAQRRQLTGEPRGEGASIPHD